MADAIIPEADIIDLLTMPISSQTVYALQAGAVQALVDLYDRKVTRDEFIAGAPKCIALYAQMAKLWLMANVKVSYEHENVNPTTIANAMDGLETLARTQAMVVIELVKRLQECPGSQDRIN